MKITLPTLRTLHRWARFALPAAALGIRIAAVPAAALADADAAAASRISLDGSSSFTLQDVSYSKGVDSGYLQFGLTLQNGGSGTIDMNDYGVKVSDKNGYSFTARLTSKMNAAIAGGQAATFRFSSELAAGDTLDQLQVVVFRWDMSKPDLMEEVGELPVAAAAASPAITETVVQADEADSSLPADAAVGFRAVRTFIVHQGEQAYVYTDLLATNLGSTSFSLPSALKYRYVGTQSDSYNATIVSGTDAALLPGEMRKVTVRAAISSGEPRAANGYSLQFYSDATGTASVFGSVDVASVTTESVIGEAEPVFSRDGAKRLAVTTTNVTTSLQSDGLHVAATVVAGNRSADIAALPTLTALFQFGGSGSAVAAADAAEHPAYLSANESETYHFEAVLPSGLTADDVRLVVLTQTAASGGASSASASSASSSAASGASTNAGEDTAASGTSTGSASAASSAGGSGSSGTASGSSSAAGSSATGSAASAAAASTGGAAPIAVSVLSGATDGASLFSAAKTYTIGDALALDKGAISSDLDIALAEFHVNPDDNDGFRNAFAKFVLSNHSKNAVAFPSFATGLITDDGASYSGTRQSSVAAKIMPGTSYTVNYAYLIPSTLSTDRLALTVSDNGSGVAVGNVAVSPQPTDGGKVLQMYPYQVTLNSTTLQWTYSNGTFTYKLSVDAKLERQPQVIVDANTASLEFDLVDGLGRTLATQSVPFTGTSKLIDGVQTLNFGGFTAVSDPLSLRVYETFATADGSTVKRLLKTIDNP